MARKDKKKDIDKKDVPSDDEEPIIESDSDELGDESIETSTDTTDEEASKDGLLALVRISEEVNIKQGHELNFKHFSFSGKLEVENPSSVDRLWDVELSLKNIETTDLESSEISIRELGTDETNNAYITEYLIPEEAKSQVIIKEYINTLPNAQEILNAPDIERDLLSLEETVCNVNLCNLPEEPEEIEEELEPEIAPEAPVEGEIKKEEEAEIEAEIEAEPKEEPVYGAGILSWLQQLTQHRKTSPEPEPEPEHEPENEEEEDDTLEISEDGGTIESEYSLDSFGISRNQLNKVTFAIAIRNCYEKAIFGIKLIKFLSDIFENIEIIDASSGIAEPQINLITWNINKIEPQAMVLLRLTAEVQVDTLEPVKTGVIESFYRLDTSFAGGVGIENFKASTRNKFYIDSVEQEEIPGKWDCKLVDENTSEFQIEITNAEVNPIENKTKNFVIINPENKPHLPSGEQWHSDIWEYTSEDYPSFSKNIEFSVVPKIEYAVRGDHGIDEAELFLASIGGAISLEAVEVPIGIEAEQNVIYISSFKDAEIQSSLTIENDGSAPLNEVTAEMKGFSDAFQPPLPEEIKLLWDGNEVELAPEAIIIESHSPPIIKVVLHDLKDSPTGMFKAGSTLELVFPIHAITPPKNSEFDPVVIYTANTFPLGQPIEYIPEPDDITKIQVIHIRRRYRVGKEIIPTGAVGNYQIVVHFENIGDMPLKNVELADKIPDNFKYSEFSLEPAEIIDEEGIDIITWVLETVTEGQKIEISYNLQGEGEYSPKDAQLAY